MSKKKEKRVLGRLRIFLVLLYWMLAIFNLILGKWLLAGLWLVGALLWTWIWYSNGGRIRFPSWLKKENDNE